MAHLILNPGNFVGIKKFNAKSGKELETASFQDSTGGIITVLCTNVKVKETTQKMYPHLIDLEVEVSNYNGLSLNLINMKMEPLKI